MSPVAVLVGAPGAGKTTVGAILAERLRVGFRDTDADIEAATGMTITDIFVTSGEDHFRVLERDAVARALRQHEGVLALGAGAVIDERTRASLAGHRVVYLDVDAAQAANRVGLNRDRPLLLGNIRGQLRALLAERRGFYEQIATITIDARSATPDAIAADATARLTGVPR